MARLARHVTPLGSAIILAVVAAVDAETHGFDSTPAKRDAFRVREGEVRRRTALRRWAGDRDWDRKAPTPRTSPRT